MNPSEDYTFILASTDGKEFIKYKGVNVNVGARNFFLDLKNKFNIDMWITFGNSFKKKRRL